VAEADAVRRLREYIDERWAVIQPKCLPHILDGWRMRPEGGLTLLTSPEATDFVDSVQPGKEEQPLFKVEDDNRHRSDRYPPNAGGGPRRNVFFEEGATLRLETIVHQAATWRLNKGFGWPRSHLVIESPDVVDEDGPVLTREALDILALKEPCVDLPSKMTVATARLRVAVEAKATGVGLDRLLKGMRACQGRGMRGHTGSNHKKCLGIEVFGPQLFLGVAAGDDWRLCCVDTGDGRAVLGKPCDLACLRFNG
jgi:hypothetical protein